MSWIKSLCLAGALALVAATGASAQQAQRAQEAQPNRLREALSQVLQAPQSASPVLAGNAGWTRAGVLVRRGGRIEITATGQWSAVNSQQFAARTANVAMTDANGYPGRTLANTPLPNANVGALIGRIGDNGRPFLIGANYSGEATADGLLFLAMNDADFSDNQGRLSISVRVTAPPRTTPETTTRPDPTQNQTPTTQTPPTRTQTETPPTRTPTRPQPETPPTRTPVESTTTQPPAQETTTAVDPTTGAPLNETTTTQETTTAAPAPETTTTAPQQEEKPEGSGIPIEWLLGAALVLIALVSIAFRPKNAPKSDPPPAAGARVSARIADDGRAGQHLNVTWKDGG